MASDMSSKYNNNSTSANEKTTTMNPAILGKNSLLIFIFIIAAAIIILIIVMGLMCLKKYRFLMKTVRNLQAAEQMNSSLPSVQAGVLGQNPVPEQNSTEKSSFNKADLLMHELVKAGSEAIFHKARMRHGTVNGHTQVICKIYKKGAKRKQVEMEVSIMRKLSAHKNLLQLVEWDITSTPFMLIMEHVCHGTLSNFLKTNKDSLCKDADLQKLFNIAAYRIAHAMNHLRSRMIMHCNLALKNILVHSFPHEVKVAEFGLARDITCTRSSRASFRKTCNKRFPMRWYPPEYFKNQFYGFKGDVWAFGIVLWEMQTFGSLPYPDLKSSEEIMCYVTAGHRNTEPEDCSPEMLQMMKDCWQERYSLRPSFTDIVHVLENILESDNDYVNFDQDSLTGKSEE